MKRAVIRWFVFRQALCKRVQRDRDEWLTLWRFADDGVPILQNESKIEDMLELQFPDHKSETRH